MFDPRLKAYVALVLLLGCSACVPAQDNEIPLMSGSVVSVAPAIAQPAHVDRGLPTLPDAAGSAHAGGTYAAMPAEAKRILEDLECNVGDPTNAQVIRIPGRDGREDFMVTDSSGPRYHYWIRSFAGRGGITGYLVQLKNCPVTTTGMRALVAEGDMAPRDVTATLLAQKSMPDAAAMAAYTHGGAGDLFALIQQLDKVPVVRWIAEADPERPLAKDARTFDHGNFVHGGFLVWDNDHFTVRQTLAADLWPCDDSQLLPCKGDPFVSGR